MEKPYENFQVHMRVPTDDLRGTKDLIRNALVREIPGLNTQDIHIEQGPDLTHSNR